MIFKKNHDQSNHMIELCHYSSLEHKTNFIQTLDLSNSTLIVSDLHSKLYWQQSLLKRDGFVAGPAVLRAEDFWKTLVQRSFPESEFVSNAWMTSYLKSALSHEFAGSVGLPYARPSSALRALNELLPILCHPESNEVMENWFSDTCKTPCSWEKWYYLAASIWENINKQSLLLSEWSAAFLLQQSGFEKFWSRNLTIDVGPEIRTIEAELLQTLSISCDIKVLVPKQTWLPQFSWISYPYEQLTQRSHKVIMLPEVNSQNAKAEFKRFTAPIAEIKFAIGQIRQWIERGKEPSQIALIAPDIEEYWPVLRWHLKKELIPFEKSETIKLGSLGPTVAWISFLKKTCGHSLKPEEFEIAEFHPLNYECSNYSTHKSLWSKRAFINASSIELQTQLFFAEDFLQWALDVWPQRDLLSQDFLEICKKWLIEAKKLEARKLRDWIEYLEDYLNQQEQTITELTGHGIGIFSLMSGIPPHKTLQIYFGCSESQLKSSSGLVSGAEVLSLQHHTGHLLAHPDRDFREYQLTALLGTGEVQFFTFAESDFKGSELVPSVFWLNGREKADISFHQLDHWNQARWEYEQFNDPTVPKDDSPKLVSEKWSFTLSPASLKAYVECPFKFFAEKGLKLVDPSVVDLDLDARTQGSIHHRLLELLTEELFSAQTLRMKLNEIVDQTINEHREMFFSEKTKELVRAQLIQLGQRFVEHEENYRKEFPRFYTLAREAWFRRDLIIAEHKITFRGKIDRLDASRDNNEAVVIDYKSDTASYRNSGSWLQNLEFQLPAYVDSVESGFAETEEKKKIPAMKVVAAHYYSLKDFSRKGFTLDEASPDVVEIPTPKSKISAEEKQNLLGGFNEILVESTKKILAGDFRAIPHPNTDCKKCPWRHVCRARI